MKKLRTIFFGTPGLSATILRYLLETNELEIIGIVTNPDTTGGRGHGIMSSPVAQLAREKGIPLLQPEKVKDEGFLQAVRELKPDICIVVAYGKILPQVLLDIPPMGFLNVHTSLLPKYRGAAPIQHALLAGEKVTGLTVQQMALAMDEGDILVQEIWNVTPEDTTGSLFERTGQRGGPLLIEAITGLVNETIVPKPQNHSEASYTKMIEKKDGELNPAWTVDEGYRAWQGFTPWPGLYTEWNGMKVTLLEIEKYLPPDKGGEQGEGEMGGLSNKKTVLDSQPPHHTRSEIHSPLPFLRGEGSGIFVVDKLPAIQLADGILVIKKIHPAGKKPMTGEEFVRGYLPR